MQNDMKHLHLNPNKNEGYLSLESKPDLSELLVQSSTFPKMLPELSSDKNEGYLSFSSLPDLPSLNVQTAPFPRMMPSLDENKNEGYLSFSSLPDLPSLNVQTAPFPRMMPGIIKDNPIYGTVNEGYPVLAFPYHGDLSTMLVQEAPFPKMMPSLEDDNEGYLSFRKDVKWFGAFYKAKDVYEVEIPKSVKYISDYAFYDTNIKRVRINRHCIYFAHSFPQGCVIIPYPDDDDE